MFSNGRDAAHGGDETAREDNVPIGYLRAFVTVLVVAHHAMIAYLPDAQQPTVAAWTSKTMLWTAFPIVDSQRVPEFGLLIGINDIFFMSLMFFISGLFVWPSLTRKGAIAFAGDRIVRLGLPFAVAAAILAPLAYYPSYLQGGGAPDLTSYADAWLSLFSLNAWPAGPAWFLWLLLAFDLLAVIAYVIVPRFGVALGRLSANGDRQPLQYITGLMIVSGAGFLAMNLYLGYDAWVHWGPFFVQAGRVLHYAVYFFAGIGVGAYGLDLGLLDVSGKLARRWWLWLPFGLAAFVALTAAFLAALGVKFQPQLPWTIALCGLFAIACASLSFSLVAVFVRFFKRAGPVFDSLRRNAYGIYLLHYAYAIWLQFALLGAPLTGLEKGGIVFATTLLLSWATTALLRTFPSIARVI
ncbi:MAG: acyltransferase [Alphaproteobacteria bacterium]|nr:acyltransferase [Alphaproteobacteria bacterium]